MAALKPRPPFQVLIMSEESRARAVKGSRPGTRSSSSSPPACACSSTSRTASAHSTPRWTKLMLAAQALADEMERERARQRAYDKARALARAGYVTGGQVLRLRQRAGHRRARRTVARRAPHQRGARPRWCDASSSSRPIGYGQRAIAKMLNAEGAPAPRSQQGRPRAWVPSSVHEVLFRDALPRRARVEPDEEARPLGPAPRERSARGPVAARVRAAPAHRVGGAVAGGARQARDGAVVDELVPRPRVGVEVSAPRPGAVRVVQRRHVRPAPHPQLGSRSPSTPARATSPAARACAAISIWPRWTRSTTRCSSASVEILTPDFVDEVVASVRAEFEAEAAADPRTPLEAELASIDAQLERLTDAIAMGGQVRTLVRRLTTLEGRRTALLDALDTTPASRPQPRCRLARVRTSRRGACWPSDGRP